MTSLPKTKEHNNTTNIEIKPKVDKIQTGTKPKQQKDETLNIVSHMETSKGYQNIVTTLPPLKKKSVTVKESVPPPVPPRGSPRPSCSKGSSQNLKTQNVSTGMFKVFF